MAETKPADTAETSTSIAKPRGVGSPRKRGGKTVYTPAQARAEAAKRSAKHGKPGKTRSGRKRDNK